MLAVLYLLFESVECDLDQLLVPFATGESEKVIDS